MPLIKGKSQKAFKHNVEAEMEHGKPQGQALAIAYSMKRKAQHKAKGGEVEHELHEATDPHHEDVMRYGEPELERVAMAKGGKVPANPFKMESDIVSRIIKNRGVTAYSEGGRVANAVEEKAGEKPAEFDDLVLRDDLESTQKDLGDHLGNAQESHDRADIVARVMASLEKKNKMPKGYPGL